MHPQPTYPAGRAESEARIAVQDGYIWPVDRVQMVTPAAIRERMIEDIGREVRERTEDAVVTEHNLLRLGWHIRQVEAHATIAFATYKAQNAVKGARGAIVRRDSAAQIAASAAAVTVFVASLALWAGHATGAL
ncbi:hypothetical protein ABIE41_003882 [Bosea sp. OAE506]|uniref:hypothetical protein n=1 Tax=Bosea sp. OAE506 TaxID=2663870 RepID=UPI00178BF4C6